MTTQLLGPAIDALYQARAARLAAAKHVKDLQALETEAKAKVLKLLQDLGLEKASGQLATAGILTDSIPFVQDWDVVHEYIRTNNRFDLLQKRIGVTAWRELYQDGILVPGTEAAVDTDLSLTKSTRK